ncbi:hypothetical protein FQ775_07560 [Nitratireductor mangrovi]|uniref:Uncharacterized protein n=1 Tax=Nitratireductor mangrovi TaxID=2599600 RepID=A0A5B8KX33_9HYPH|nr:hypothetical protein [Nitratireductor mangrovi]QDZ00244.1 hypothetical protein FQ775_07560 [Nitratireductor mangrovi]
MRVMCIFVTDNNYPLFATPIFSDKDGDFFVQTSTDGTTISSFTRIVPPQKHFLRIEKIEHDQRNIGDPILYCLALDEGWYWLGTTDKLRMQIRSELYKSAVENFPFLRLEIGRLLGDRQMITYASLDGARKLARISTPVAEHWRIGSSFEREVDQEVTGIIQDGAQRRLVPIRISIPQICVDELDRTARDKNVKRAELVRILIGEYRSEIYSFSFWKQFGEFTDRFLNKHYIGRRFEEDPEFREIVLFNSGATERSLSRTSYRKILGFFSYRRSTVRINGDDQILLFENFQNQELYFAHGSIEEFYGFAFLFLASLDDKFLEERIIHQRNLFFEELRANTEGGEAKSSH